MKQTILLIISEVLYVALMACVAYIIIQRNRLKHSEKRFDSKLADFNALQERHEKLRSINKSNTDALKASTQKLKNANAEIEKNRELLKKAEHNSTPNTNAYKRRIKNLETFREMFFDIEEKHENSLETQAQLQHEVEELKQKLNQQSDLIEQLSELTNKLEDENHDKEETIKDLKDVIQTLKDNIRDSQLKLNISEREQESLRAQLEHLDQLKSKVKAIEKQDKAIMESAEYNDGDLEGPGKSNIHETRISYGKESEYKSVLKDKESQIKKLRLECNTLADQYEQLARLSFNESLTNTKEGSPEKMELKKTAGDFQENTKNLNEKRAEFETLENYYLELDSITGNEELVMQMDATNTMVKNLESENLNIVDRSLRYSSEENAQSLKELKEKLKDNQALLNKTREDYRSVEEQFLAIADEENELRDKNRLLQCELDQLKQQHQDLETKYVTLASKKYSK